MLDMFRCRNYNTISGLTSTTPPSSGSMQVLPLLERTLDKGLVLALKGVFGAKMGAAIRISPLSSRVALPSVGSQRDFVRNVAFRNYSATAGQGVHYAIPDFISHHLSQPRLLQDVPDSYIPVIWNRMQELTGQQADPVTTSSVFSSYASFFAGQSDNIIPAIGERSVFEALKAVDSDNGTIYQLLQRSGRIGQVRPEKIILDHDGKGTAYVGRGWAASNSDVISRLELSRNDFLMSIAREFTRNRNGNSIYRRGQEGELFSLIRTANPRTSHVWFALERFYADTFRNEGNFNRALRLFSGIKPDISDIAVPDGNYFRWLVNKGTLTRLAARLEPGLAQDVKQLWKMDPNNSLLCRVRIGPGPLKHILETFWDEISAGRLKNDNASKGSNPEFVACIERGSATVGLSSGEITRLRHAGIEVLERGYDSD